MAGYDKLSPEQMPTLTCYWENRARRYAQKDEGLPAVCSYGMPTFYNRAIDFCQRLALEPWLKGLSGKHVLDVGCGVGRWSRLMALRGAKVTGIDISPTMISEAAQRAAVEKVADGCQFLVQDLAELHAGGQYDLILGVTVLQHILDQSRLRAAVASLAANLRRGGRMVLLEAAPSRGVERCDSPIFRARDPHRYVSLFRESGLSVEALTGVDPMPLKTLFLPYYARLPKPLGLGGLAAVTAVSWPVDVLFGRRWVKNSWHKLFVLRHAYE
jgi:SAM-dependent methyltransferase